MRKIVFSILLVINLAVFAWAAWNIVVANGNFMALIYIPILMIHLVNIAWVLANLTRDCQPEPKGESDETGKP